MKSTFLLPALLLSASTQLFASPINLAYQKPNQAQLTRTVLDVDSKPTAYSVIDTLILPDSVLNKYVGAYQVEGTEDTVGFTNENHQLVAHTKNGRSWKLTAENPSKFVIEDKRYGGGQSSIRSTNRQRRHETSEAQGVIRTLPSPSWWPVLRRVYGLGPYIF
jgi:hypothetical protein